MRNSRRERGFIILFGSRKIIFNEGRSAQAVCPRCQQKAIFQAKGYRSWFTLFFIPIFPVGGKHSFCQCENCKAQFKLTLEQLAANLQSSQQQQIQQGIAMYNSLRASPANSVTLNNLMLLYASLREYDQALSAAREFPQALNASEQCMTTLGRVLLEQGRQPEAVQWFDAALARNAMHGEAAYFKAIALTGKTPPDFPAAVTAARVARSAGFPNADNLLREVEARAAQ